VRGALWLQACVSARIIRETNWPLETWAQDDLGEAEAVEAAEMMTQKGKASLRR